MHSRWSMTSQDKTMQKPGSLLLCLGQASCRLTVSRMHMRDMGLLHCSGPKIEPLRAFENFWFCKGQTCQVLWKFGFPYKVSCCTGNQSKNVCLCCRSKRCWGWNCVFPASPSEAFNACTYLWMHVLSTESRRTCTRSQLCVP